MLRVASLSPQSFGALLLRLGAMIRPTRKGSADSSCFDGDRRTETCNGCRDARSVRPLCQRLQHRGFNGDGRTDRASLQPLFVSLYYDGRTDRASLHGLLVSPREEFADSSVESENSSRRGEIKVRKNEMKLRKNEIISPKNFSVPRWRIKTSS